MSIATEIRSFYSIKEIQDALTREVEQYRSVADEYSQWLGSLLRDSEGTKENDKRQKEMEILQKGKLKSKAKPTKKGKSKKPRTSTDWIQFKDIMLCASEQGEAEILFDAIEEINRKTEQLEKVIASTAELEKSGLGKDIIYIAYICNGVPEKIVLRHSKDREFEEKFQYIADFSLTKQT